MREAREGLTLRLLFSQQIAGRLSPFLCYPFEKPKKNLLIFSDSSLYVHHNTTSITLPQKYTAHIWGNLTSRARQFRSSSVLAYDRQHNDEHDLPKPVQDEECHAGVAHLSQDGAEARNRSPTPRINPTQSLLVARDERRVTNEPVCGDS